MTSTTTEAALLRAIALEPEDDIRRLGYADLIDDDQPERAEFIRLQIALAGPDSELPAPREEITDRLSLLWHFGAKKQFACAGVELFSHAADFRGGVTVRVARGFAETLHLPTLADLCEQKRRGCEQKRRGCEHCGGRGEQWVSRSAPLHSGQLGLVGEYISCEECELDYTGKPTQLALDVMLAHPTITRVVVGDRRPWHAFDARMESVYQFVTGDFDDLSGERIPREIFAEVAKLGIGKVRENIERAVIDFASEQAALDALAVAAGQWLRQEAVG